MLQRFEGAFGYLPSLICLGGSHRRFKEVLIFEFFISWSRWIPPAQTDQRVHGPPGTLFSVRSGSAAIPYSVAREQKCPMVRSIREAAVSIASSTNVERERNRT